MKYKSLLLTLKCVILWHYSQLLKVKSSLYRPGVAQRFPGGLGSHIFMTFGTWRWWGRQPHAPAAFTPRNVPGRGWVDSRAMVRSEGNMSLKNPVTPPGIDPWTVWLVEQCSNHYSTSGPIRNYYSLQYNNKLTQTVLLDELCKVDVVIIILHTDPATVTHRLTTSSCPHI